MREAIFVIPGDLATPTGGYRYDRRVLDELPAHGWHARHAELPGDYPAPSDETLSQTARTFAGFDPAIPVMVDGLALGAMPRAIIAALKAPLIALIHHPLAFETGLAPERVDYLHRTERQALQFAKGVVATSRSTAELLAREFGVERNQVTVAEPGTDPAPRARGNASPPRLLSVGAVSRRKGHDTLAKALGKIRDLDWECRIAGSLDRDLVAAENLRREIANGRIEDRVHLLGSLDDAALDREYAEASLFVLPSHFEGYGMAFTEALARGLPIVTGSGGALVETVPQAAGVFVEPGNAGELALMLRRLLTHPEELSRRSDAAWAYAKQLPRWSDTAKLVAGAFERAAGKTDR
jgi:glycosyltransferase involved in cell wall biosynthesis